MSVIVQDNVQQVDDDSSANILPTLKSEIDDLIPPTTITDTDNVQTVAGNILCMYIIYLYYHELSNTLMFC